MNCPIIYGRTGKVLSALDSKHRGKKGGSAGHACYGQSLLGSRDSFMVLHFAGAVTYSIKGFIDKNRDALHGDLTSLLQASSVPFISATLFPRDDDSDGDSGGGGHRRQKSAPRHRRGGGGGGGGSHMPTTVAHKFRTQLGELLRTLNAMEPSHVRRVVPCPHKARHSRSAAAATANRRRCS